MGTEVLAVDMLQRMHSCTNTRQAVEQSVGTWVSSKSCFLGCVIPPLDAGASSRNLFEGLCRNLNDATRGAWHVESSQSSSSHSQNFFFSTTSSFLQSFCIPLMMAAIAAMATSPTVTSPSRRSTSPMMTGQPDNCSRLPDCDGVNGDNDEEVCGSDMVLYPTRCHMRRASCRAQLEIAPRPKVLCRGNSRSVEE